MKLSKKKKIWRQKTYTEDIGRVYHCNNLTSSNASFEGVSLKPCYAPIKKNKSKSFPELQVRKKVEVNEKLVTVKASYHT